jgi:EVE domain
MHRYVSEVDRDAPSESVRAWIGVVSRAHVRRGVAGGFAQLGHGKQSPLARLSVGDWLVYYSPTTEYPDGAPLRAFTALGRVVGEAPYRFDMGGGFVPYRRDIAYVKSAREVLIRDLAAELEFVRGRRSWGMLARRGHFEISLADLRTIAAAMGADLPRASHRR